MKSLAFKTLRHRRNLLREKCYLRHIFKNSPKLLPVLLSMLQSFLCKISNISRKYTDSGTQEKKFGRFVRVIVTKSQIEREK